MQDERTRAWQAFDELLAAADHLYRAATDDAARKNVTALIDLLESAVAVAVTAATGTPRT